MTLGRSHFMVEQTMKIIKSNHHRTYNITGLSQE